MYYYISGELVLCEPGTAVIDAGGVGYRITISDNTLGKLTANGGGKVKLFTHFAVKEDAHELYGFYTEEERAAFRLLISISGVGAKSAISVLSIMTSERFALAVSTGDSKSISKASGIGAKTAARIILELKDKIAKQSYAEVTADSEISSPLPSGGKLAAAMNALLVLQYTRTEAQFALRDIDTETLEIEGIVREALKKLMK